MEIWKDIEGYEGIYQVSNEGRVRSLDHVRQQNIKGKIAEVHYKGRILLNHTSKTGHKTVRIGTKPSLVHRLVAEAFIPNPNNYDVVHHKNHDKSDNRVENLEWMDRGQHIMIHSKEFNSKRVDQIDKISGEIIHQWVSSIEAARQLGFSQGAISECCNGKYASNNIYKGYVWKRVC